MRHGETVWNYKGIIQGRSNNRLSENGKKQVEEQAEKLKDINFDMIFVSPLMRTIQTANIVNKYHKMNLIKDERIIEINQGLFTGRKKNSLTDEEIIIKKEQPESAGIETQQKIYERVKDFYECLVNNYIDKRILVVTHRGIAKTLYYIINNKGLANEIDDPHLFENAEVRKCICIKN